ncbi:MAG: hypothetical protein LC732_03950, partial [Acidobacteria bacterium]|nr:hypothetical protein [Acidobacteriota bacterium]
NNLEIGRTNESGELLLPNLRAYHANRISFEDQDVPLGFAFDVKQALVAPPYRGGGTLEFDVRRIQAVTGHFVLEIDGSRRIPAFGTARTSDAESVVGEGGEFYFETLPTGSHRVEVETNVGRCETTIRVAESEEFILDLQEVACSGEVLP